MHVLVADDDRGDLALLVSRLKEIGYVPRAVRGGPAALKAVQENPGIRLAILNWMLPGLDGLEVARELRRAKANIYTVVLVGRCFCEEANAAFGSWADEFAGKPLSPEALQALLERAEAAAKLREHPSPVESSARRVAKPDLRRFNSEAST